MTPSPGPRSHRSPTERDARSRLLKRCADEPLLRGSLVSMQRTCGKEGCHCVSGQKHVSLYLAIRVGKQRKMVYIPSELEQQVRDWVQSSQEIDRLLELVSQSCLEQLLRKKQEASEERQKSRPRKG